MGKTCDRCWFDRTLAGMALLLFFAPHADAAARSTKVIFNNQTTHQLKLINASLSHGEWTTQPPKIIPAKKQVSWESESNGIATGTEGKATFRIQGGGQVYVWWDNPYAGSNSYDGSWPESSYQLVNSGGSGHNATITWTLQPLVIPHMPRTVINSLAVRVVTSKQHLAGSDNVKYFDIGPLGWKLLHNGHHGHAAGSDITHPLDLHNFKGVLTTDDIVWLRLNKKGIGEKTGSTDGVDGEWRPHSIHLIVNGDTKHPFLQFPVDQWLRRERPTWQVNVRPYYSVQERFVHALRLIPNNTLSEGDKLIGLVTTPVFKMNGLSGWKTSGVPVAFATGKVIWQGNSTDGLATIDLAVEKIVVGGKTFLLDGKNGVEHPRFLRVEYQYTALGALVGRRNPVPNKGERVEIGGNVWWDTDDEWYYEIHPRGPHDVKVLQ